MNYDILYRKYKAELLKKIKKAAEEDDIKSIKKLSTLLESLDIVKNRLSEISKIFSNIEKFMDEEDNIISESPRLSPKEIGEKRIQEFMKKLKTKNIFLEKIKGRIYKNRAGKLIGIATASEFSYRENRWFLGLPVNNYYSIVLICESRNGKKYDIIFPHKFIESYKPHFSKDSNDQIKFNIVKINDNFFITDCVLNFV